MPRFSRTFIVNAPLERVATFHSHTAVLKQLNPPPLIVQLHEIELLAEGSVSSFTLWFGPVPIYWEAAHKNVTPQNGFVDVQTKGPFESWVHHHHLETVDDESSQVTDMIEAQFGRGIWRGLVSRVMWLSLPIVFGYRAFQTRRLS